MTTDQEVSAVSANGSDAVVEHQMKIPIYQIHNVLRDYVRQLQRRMERRQGNAIDADNLEKAISAPDKRRMVQERVTAEVVERIIHLDIRESRDPGGETTRPPDPAGGAGVPRELVYHVLKNGVMKQKCRLQLERVENLVRRFQETGKPDTPEKP